MDLWQKLLTSLVMLFVFDLILPLHGMKDRGERRKRRKCPRVCLRELSKEYNKLKEEIDRLKIQKQAIITGPKGPRGHKGDPGLPGPPGLPGAKGEPGQTFRGEESPSFELPNCASDEFLTANGKKLFCVKLDLKSLNVIDSSNARQPFPPNREFTPTISPDQKRNMAVFEKRGMIQTIRGDTWDVGVVKHGANFYLFSSYLGREFTVYKWFRDVFTAIQSFHIASARHWTTFVIDNHLYVAVASSGNLYSPVFKLDSSKVVEYQQIRVQGVFDVKAVYIGKQLYLIYTSYHGPTSQIHKWHNTKRQFVYDQSIKAFGPGLETFRIGNNVFLAFTAMEDGRYVSLYFSDGKGPFREYHVVRNIKEGYSLHHIGVGQEHFLAVAKFKNEPSLILRWDGKTFRHHQAIPTLFARNFASITSSLIGRGKEETYLAVASKSGHGIYSFDDKSKLFIKLQELDANFIRDVDFFSMNRHVYLVVSAARKTNIYRGIIGGQG